MCNGSDFQWANELYASDYFEQLYGFAVNLIKKGLAYVDDSTTEADCQAERNAYYSLVPGINMLKEA